MDQRFMNCIQGVTPETLLIPMEYISASHWPPRKLRLSYPLITELNELDSFVPVPRSRLNSVQASRRLLIERPFECEPSRVSIPLSEPVLTSSFALKLLTGS